MVRRIVKNPEERREEIITMAQQMFLDLEYEKTSLNDIVKALGVAKGTVYHYFKSKEELLDAVVNNMSDEFVQIVKKQMDKTKTSALKKLEKLIKASNITDNSKETINKLHRSGNMGLHVRLLALCIKKIAPLYAEVIQQGCKEGVFKTQYPLETAEFFLAGIQFVTDEGIYSWSHEEITRRSKAISSIMETQLGLKKGSLNL
jgi:AcrR family transcriptional regulator